MADLPKSIRVGYRDYTVEDWPRQASGAAGRFGECDKVNAVIRVCTDHGAQKAANTLLHEALHAAWDVADLADSDLEEKAVTGLSNVLTQIWRDNPELIAFMSDSLKN